MGERTNQMNTDWNEGQITSTEDDDSLLASESFDDYDENTEQIRANIEDTRAEMSQTINEIQERLSPENLMGQVKETVREATIGKVERVMDKVGETIADATEPAREVVGRAGTAIKETGASVADVMWKNPVPVALIGLGLGMLMARRFRGNGSDYETRYTAPRTRQNFRGGQPQYGGTTAGANTGTLDQVKETASDLAHRSTNALSNLGTKAKDGASTIGMRVGRVMRENPLAVGAVAVAAGTAVGLALPSSQFEKQYVGEASETLVDKAQEIARGAINKAQDAVQQMAQQGETGASKESRSLK